MKTKDLAILGAVVVAAAAIVVTKQMKPGVAPAPSAPAPAPAETAKALPRLIDLGAGKCIPCKAMKPILEDLATNYAGLFRTEFIDVWQDQEAGKRYQINLIPTQIFFDADGQERFRHEGFFSKEEILAKWKELGVGSDERRQ